ncbi:MAG: 4-hydroxy-tetrahydrodipicolinate reductase [Bdellovibrionales bacterium]
MRLALAGDKGRMGRSLKALIKKDSSKKVVALANSKTSPDAWKAKEIDLVIDFSSPRLFSQVLLWCFQNKKPFVSGTTGLSLKQKKQMKSFSKKIPIFYSENMSWGVFQLGQYLRQTTKAAFSILLEDKHHKYKKDRPSGTALRLKKEFPLSLQKKVRIKSYRQGLEFGTHRISLKTSEEEILLEHKALNRSVFSKGALKASEFLVKKSRGLYSIVDLYK